MPFRGWGPESLVILHCDPPSEGTALVFVESVCYSGGGGLPALRSTGELRGDTAAELRAVVGYRW